VSCNKRQDFFEILQNQTYFINSSEERNNVNLTIQKLEFSSIYYWYEQLNDYSYNLTNLNMTFTAKYEFKGGIQLAGSFNVTFYNDNFSYFDCEKFAFGNATMNGTTYQFDEAFEYLINAFRFSYFKDSINNIYFDQYWSAGVRNEAFRQSCENNSKGDKLVKMLINTLNRTSLAGKTYNKLTILPNTSLNLNSTIFNLGFWASDYNVITRNETFISAFLYFTSSAECTLHLENGKLFSFGSFYFTITEEFFFTKDDYSTILNLNYRNLTYIYTDGSTLRELGVDLFGGYYKSVTYDFEHYLRDNLGSTSKVKFLPLN